MAVPRQQARRCSARLFVSSSPSGIGSMASTGKKSGAVWRVVLACDLALLAGGSCRAASPPADPKIVTGWMRTLYALVRAERLSPPVASRVFAYGAVALYEGLAPGSPELRTLGGQLNGLRELPSYRRGEAYDLGNLTAGGVGPRPGGVFREGGPPAPE